MRLVCRRSSWCSSRCRDLCARVVSWYRIESGFMKEGDDANGAAYGMLALLPRVPIGRSEGVASAPALGGRVSSQMLVCDIAEGVGEGRLYAAAPPLLKDARLSSAGPWEGRWSLPWELFVCSSDVKCFASA